MGFTNWSDEEYTTKNAYRAATHTPIFAYTSAVNSGAVAAKVHDSLNPKGVKFREARDSTAHPNSVPVAVLMDVTGSMLEVPKTFQAALPKLMGLLVRKGYVEHPAILVGGIGDATCDRAPLQVGQFESGIEIETDCTNLFLEGGGGGQMTESYELALDFIDRHTVTDHWEKRGQKGYLFVTGDEKPYPKVKSNEVSSVLGEITEVRTVEQVVDSLKERWNVFFILPNQTSHFNDSSVRSTWKKLFPEGLILLEDPSAICETIATQIGMMETDKSEDDLVADLVDYGTHAVTARSVSKAIVPRKESGTVQKIDSSSNDSGLVVS